MGAEGERRERRLEHQALVLPLVHVVALGDPAIGLEVLLEDPRYHHRGVQVEVAADGLAAEVAALEEKSRRRDLLLDEREREAFYAARLPDDVLDGKSLKRRMKARSMRSFSHQHQRPRNAQRPRLAMA